MRDLHNNVDVKVALNTAAITSNTTTNGAIIDMRGYSAVEFVIQSGALTDGTYTVLLESGNASDLSDKANVVDSAMLGTEALASFIATEDNTVKKVGMVAHGSYRYVRLSLVSASTTAGGTLGATVVLDKLVK